MRPSFGGQPPMGNKNPAQFGAKVKPMMPSQAMSNLKTRIFQHVRIGNLQKKI